MVAGEPNLRQAASNAVVGGQGRAVSVTFERPTATYNLVFVVATTPSSSSTLTGPSGFTAVPGFPKSIGSLQVGCWYREGAPTTDSVTVTISQDRSLQVRAMEYEGVAQANAFDKVVWRVKSSSYGQPSTGSCSPAQADSVLVSVVVNRHASCSQYGFTGGLIRLFEQVSPGQIGSRVDTDENRTRITIHHNITTAILSYALSAVLSTIRDWIAFIVVFKGGSTGPKRLTTDTTGITITGGGELSCYAPFNTDATAVTITGTSQMYPFEYQYRVGPAQKTIGVGTRWPVAEIEGLEGWELRTSDDDLPRSDGAIRGVDLMSARQILITFGVFGDTNAEREENLDELFRALIPQREQDWALTWRHPGRPVRVVYCRPVSMIRGLDQRRILFQDQTVALRAVDPRHYSAIEHAVQIPNTAAASVDNPPTTVVNNIGNGPAYPVITMQPDQTVTAVELVNRSTDVSWRVQTTIGPKSVLVGDMSVRVTGAGRPVITLDGVSKYGAWQFPKDPFRINPGINEIYLVTTPPGADIAATVAYRDCWSG